MPKRSSALDTARTEALRACLTGEMRLSPALCCRIEDERGLRLDAETYHMLQDATGLNRRDINRAIDAMAAAGKITVGGEYGTVRVRLALEDGA